MKNSWRNVKTQVNRLNSSLLGLAAEDSCLQRWLVYTVGMKQRNVNATLKDIQGSKWEGKPLDFCWKETKWKLAGEMISRQTSSSWQAVKQLHQWRSPVSRQASKWNTFSWWHPRTSWYLVHRALVAASSSQIPTVRFAYHFQFVDLVKAQLNKQARQNCKIYLNDKY